VERGGNGKEWERRKRFAVLLLDHVAHAFQVERGRGHEGALKSSLSDLNCGCERIGEGQREGRKGKKKR
jgi:hypothetical protein